MPSRISYKNSSVFLNFFHTIGISQCWGMVLHRESFDNRAVEKWFQTPTRIQKRREGTSVISSEWAIHFLRNLVLPFGISTLANSIQAPFFLVTNYIHFFQHLCRVCISLTVVRGCSGWVTLLPNIVSSRIPEFWPISLEVLMGISYRISSRDFSGIAPRVPRGVFGGVPMTQ